MLCDLHAVCWAYGDAWSTLSLPHGFLVPIPCLPCPAYGSTRLRLCPIVQGTPGPSGPKGTAGHPGEKGERVSTQITSRGGFQGVQGS